jgi:5,10-methylenetetrahydromethanopterin reductase
MRMLHPVGYAPPRPIEVPVLISALGPKGLAVARELADGLFTANGETEYAKHFGRAALAVHGTVLDRHLAVHHQHLVGLNQADEAAWPAGSWAAIPATTVTGSAAELTERLAAFAEAGISEVVYQPTGLHIARELEAFITAARAVPVA